jgi:acetyl-CoA synthetase
MNKYVVQKRGKYYPSEEMKKIAWVKDAKIYSEAKKNPVKFWENLAREGILWEKEWDKAYEEKLPYFKWFKGGKLNFCVNAVDRHLGKDKTALIWVPEPTNEKPVKISYRELYDKVNKFANVLKSYGVRKGDVVAIYLPLVPEALIAMLACTRIGAIHSVVFSAFSGDALRARILDGKAKVLVGGDGYYRRGKKEDLRKKINIAIKNTSVKKVIMVNRVTNKKYSGKFTSFKEEMQKANSYCKPEIMNSEDIMFILYTSGTTGKPKGIVHDTGGYAVQSYWTAKWNFNLHDEDIMWCTADIGWITGHTYAFYGPLLNGATSLIYEGSPDYPNMGRWWDIIEQNKVSVFYTAPTAIRMFMMSGEKYLKRRKLETLKVLATVGEPIDKKAWNWYFKNVGKSRCPVIDTWWQTETGGTLINVLPGVGPFVPMVAGLSFPGTSHEVVDKNGKKVKGKASGFLVQVSPYAPGMLHGVYNNHEKYVKTYWSTFNKKYDTSDGGFYVDGGMIRVTGRTDDVMKVAGHRLATAELENAINGCKIVNESAVVSMPDQIKGEVPIAFVVLKKKLLMGGDLDKKIKMHVDKAIGPTARPAKVYFVNELPKTRSGKIMRRIMKNIIRHEEPEGLMTLINPESVDEIKMVVENGK